MQRSAVRGTAHMGLNAEMPTLGEKALAALARTRLAAIVYCTEFQPAGRI